MTDNDWRNARIEEAAKAIREVREVVIPRGDGYVSVTDADDATLARAALAVFEKALGEATVTPTAHEVTTDERARVLAILSDMDYNDGGMMRWSSGRPTEQAEKVADRIVAELSGFRRSEVPEPSECAPLCVLLGGHDYRGQRVYL